MARKLPPFAAVRAFEAVARHLNVKQAADELCLSASAVSHQIRALEEYFDMALFERRRNRLTLTLTGRAYAGKMTNLLNAFDESTRSIREAGHRPFRVLCTPGFAARWLVPRLDRLSFGDRVRLRVSDGAPSLDFAANEADLVIQWADAPVSGVVTEPLMQSGRYPVISPGLKAREAVEVPEDLRRLTLVHDENDNEDWRAIYGPKSKRLKDVELILRFMAFYEKGNAYKSPMKHFLNDYMKEKRDLADKQLQEIGDIFARTVAFVNSALGNRTFRPDRSLNTAVFDSVATALARRLSKNGEPDAAAAEAAYNNLFDNSRFVEGYIRSTADDENVKKRMEEADEAFANI